MPKEYDAIRLVHVKDMKPGDEYSFINDIASISYSDEDCPGGENGKDDLVNAVMGYTSKGFHEGTVGLDELIHNNTDSSSPANVFFGGGDTLLEFKSLSPGSYLNALKILKRICSPEADGVESHRSRRGWKVRHCSSLDRRGGRRRKNTRQK